MSTRNYNRYDVIDSIKEQIKDVLYDLCEKMKLKNYSIKIDEKNMHSRKIILLVDTNEVFRQTVLHNISILLKTPIKSHPISFIGAIKLENFVICVKPLNKQGINANGLENEYFFIDKIKQYCNHNPINVILNSKNKIFEIKNVIDAVNVGNNTSGNKKADVHLITDNYEYIPISLKKDNAEHWGTGKIYNKSFENYLEHQNSLKNIKEINADYHPKKGVAKEIENEVNKYIEEGYIVLVNAPHLDINIWRMFPSIGWDIDYRFSKYDCIFGSDILPNGCILCKTFFESDFIFNNKNNTLNIQSTNIYTNLSEIINSEYDLKILVRNFYNNSFPIKYKKQGGLQSLAVFNSRINKNVRLIDISKY